MNSRINCNHQGLIESLSENIQSTLTYSSIVFQLPAINRHFGISFIETGNLELFDFVESLPQKLALKPSSAVQKSDFLMASTDVQKPDFLKASTDVQKLDLKSLNGLQKPDFLKSSTIIQIPDFKSSNALQKLDLKSSTDSDAPLSNLQKLHLKFSTGLPNLKSSSSADALILTPQILEVSNVADILLTNLKKLDLKSSSGADLILIAISDVIYGYPFPGNNVEYTAQLKTMDIHGSITMRFALCRVFQSIGRFDEANQVLQEVQEMVPPRVIFERLLLGFICGNLEPPYFGNGDIASIANTHKLSDQLQTFHLNGCGLGDVAGTKPIEIMNPILSELNNCGILDIEFIFKILTGSQISQSSFDQLKHWEIFRLGYIHDIISVSLKDGWDPILIYLILYQRMNFVMLSLSKENHSIILNLQNRITVIMSNSAKPFTQLAGSFLLSLLNKYLCAFSGQGRAKDGGKHAECQCKTMFSKCIERYAGLSHLQKKAIPLEWILFEQVETMDELSASEKIGALEKIVEDSTEILIIADEGLGKKRMPSFARTAITKPNIPMSVEPVVNCLWGSKSELDSSGLLVDVPFKKDLSVVSRIQKAILELRQSIDM